MPQFLGQYPSKSLHKIAIAIAGFWITTNTLNHMWKDPNQKNHVNQKQNIPQITNNLKPISIKDKYKTISL